MDRNCVIFFFVNFLTLSSTSKDIRKEISKKENTGEKRNEPKKDNLTEFELFSKPRWQVGVSLAQQITQSDNSKEAAILAGQISAIPSYSEATRSKVPRNSEVFSLFSSVPKSIVAIGYDIANSKLDRALMLDCVAIINAYGFSYKSCLEVPPDFRASKFNVGIARKKFSQVRKEIAEIIYGKIIVGYKIARFLKSFNISHNFWDIRDAVCLNKYCSLFNNAESNIKQMYNHFFGLSPNENSRPISTEEKANQVFSLYRRFQTKWETQVRELKNSFKIEIRTGKEESIIFEEPSVVHCNTYTYRPISTLPSNHLGINVEYYKNNNMTGIIAMDFSKKIVYDVLFLPKVALEKTGENANILSTSVAKSRLLEFLKNHIIVGHGFLNYFDNSFLDSGEVYDTEILFGTDNLSELIKTKLYYELVGVLTEKQKALFAMQLYILYFYKNNDLRNVVDEKNTLMRKYITKLKLIWRSNFISIILWIVFAISCWSHSFSSDQRI